MQMPAAIKFCWLAGICPGLLKRLPALIIGIFLFVLIHFYLCHLWKNTSQPLRFPLMFFAFAIQYYLCDII